MTHEEKKRFDEKLAFYHYTEDDLTQEELQQLVQEVKDEISGGTSIDGVLFHKGINYVRLYQEQLKNAKK